MKWNSSLDAILLKDLELEHWLGRNRKKWLKNWARSERGRDMLSDLLDRGYTLNWPPPIGGGARNFDAVDDTIHRGGVDDATLDVNDSDSCILQSLCKLDAVANAERRVCGKKQNALAGNAGYALSMTNAEVMRFIVSDATDLVTAGTLTMTAGTWYSFTGVLTANTATNDDVALYRDGTLDQTTNSTVLAGLANALQFRCGANSAATAGQFWDGDIAYCRFWKKTGAAWTARERDSVIEAHNKLYLPQDAFMELQWILWDAGAPTVANDYTDNGFDGTYIGTVFVEDPKRVYKGSVSPIFVVRQPQPPAGEGQPFLARFDAVPFVPSRVKSLN